MLILAVLVCLIGESLSGNQCSDIRCETVTPKVCKNGLVKGDCGCHVCAREAGESCSQTGWTNGGKCGKYLTCEKGICRPPAACILLPCWARYLQCKGGKVKGRCGCDECARVEGESCGWKDHRHIGECDEYLQCYKGVCRPPATCLRTFCWFHDKTLKCKGGKVKGRCGCDECARVEGETCGWKDHRHIGECDAQLECNQGVCRPQNYKKPCDGKSVTY